MCFFFVFDKDFYKHLYNNEHAPKSYTILCDSVWIVSIVSFFCCLLSSFLCFH